MRCRKYYHVLKFCLYLSRKHIYLSDSVNLITEKFYSYCMF